MSSRAEQRSPLLAYAGSALGHATVAGATGDDLCRAWIEQWWSEASAHLDQPARGVGEYRTALLARFANARIQHRLTQIAADGSQKLPIRVLPVVRAERAAGRLPDGGLRILAAWVCHLRGVGAPVSDVCAAELVPLAAGRLGDAVRRVLQTLDDSVAGDRAAVSAVTRHCEELLHMSVR